MKKSSFGPLINNNTKILILGTMPGDESIKQNQYYANPTNKFWHILYSIFNEDYSQSYEERCEFLIRKGIGLWDVLLDANRRDSLDSSIKNEIPNDIQSLLNRYPNVELIVFNGSKAEALFKKHNKSQYSSIKFVRLSSTSNTPGKHVKTLNDKILEWEMAIKNT